MITKWYEIVCNTCGCAQHFAGTIKVADSQFIDLGGIVIKKKHYCDERCFAKSKQKRKGNQNE